MVQSTGRGRGTSKKRWDNHHVDSAKSGAATGHGSAMPPPWKSVVRNPGGANPGLFTTQDFGVGAPGEAGGVRWGNLCLGIRLPISLDHPPILSLPSDAGYPPYGVMLPDIRERWSGGIKYDGGSGGDGGSVGRAGTEACRIPISQSEREHFFDECGVNESFCDGHQLRLRGVVVGNIVGGPITPALG